MSDEINNISHLAIIMDGNARWAKKNGIAKIEGHKKGAKVIKEIIKEVIDTKIPYLTLYSFSSENWQRDDEEVSYLLNLLKFYLKTEISSLNSNNIRLKVIGRIQLLNKNLQLQIKQAEELTKHNTQLTLCLAFSYGGRLEIVDACQKLINNGAVDKIDEKIFRQYLYDPLMPDVDLLIRTGGFFRISNFLLWQIAYAELYFSNKFWPDFNKLDLMEAINDYSTRQRNFGGR